LLALNLEALMLKAAFALALWLCLLAGIGLLNLIPAKAWQDKTQVVLLGTGTPNADPDRAGPAVAVVVNDTPYLIDCGPGVVRRAAAAARNGVKGLAVEKLRRAFITHLHSDHTVGYPDLIFTPAVLDRDAPLEVYGPPGLRAMTKHILAAYKEDIAIRLRGLEPSKPAGYVINTHEIKLPRGPSVIYRDANVTVKAFAVKHGSWKHAYGFRFEAADCSVVISGDCAPSQSIVENCQGCDVLVHEVYSTTGFAQRPPEWQRYHASFHTSSRELAELAKQAQPKLLILYHQLLWGATQAELLDEIKRAGYTGKVVFGNDLDVY
jgi:ribonuclease BN (tRNA processing enzyme)